MWQFILKLWKHWFRAPSPDQQITTQSTDKQIVENAEESQQNKTESSDPITTQQSPTIKQTSEPSQLPQLEEVKENICIRLWPDTTRESLESTGCLFEEGPDGLLAAFVYDFEDRVVSIPSQHLSSWDISREQLFHTAMKNLPSLADAPLKKLEAENVTTFCMSGTSHFVSSQMLRLHTHPECIGPYGSLIAIPSRHVMLAHPISDEKIHIALRQMLTASARIHQEAPGTLTSDLYWWSDGEWTRLPCHIEGMRIDFSPPQEFFSMLNDIAPGKFPRPDAPPVDDYGASGWTPDIDPNPNFDNNDGQDNYPSEPL